jgi:hypothetical protein
MRCLDCEYSLRGLPRDGRCPECGAPILRSWEWHEAAVTGGEPPLWMSSPAWLRRMGAGCALVLASALGHMILTLIGAIIQQPVGGAMAAAASLFIGTSLALIVGLWLLGSREPATPSGLRDHTIVRAGAVVEVLRVVRSFVWNPRTFDGHWYIAIVTTLLAAAVTAMLWRRIARLTRRAAAAKPSRVAASWLAWLVPVVMVVQVVFFRLLPTGRNGAMLIAPQPVTGEATALVLVPVGLMRGGAIGPALIFWSFGMLAALTALLMLAMMALAFFRAAALSSTSRRERAGEEAQPVAGHDAGDVGVVEPRG